MMKISQSNRTVPPRLAQFGGRGNADFGPPTSDSQYQPRIAQRGSAATEVLTADYADSADIRNIDFQSVRRAWKAFARGLTKQFRPLNTLNSEDMALLLISFSCV